MPNTDDFKKNAGDAAQQAKEKAGKLAHDNRDKFAGVLGKLTSKIDEKAQDAALKGADKLAEQRPDAGDGEAPTPPAPGQTPPPGV